MNTKTVLLAATLAITIPMAVFAHGGATGIIKQRMDGMTAMGKALGTVADMFKGKTKFDAAAVAASAVTVREHAGRLEKLFPDTPESRTGHQTEALPKIWENKAGFLAIGKQLELATIALEAAAKSEDQASIKAEFGKLTKTCSACHQDFRKPKG